VFRGILIFLIAVALLAQARAWARPSEQALVLVGKSNEFGAVHLKLCSRAINARDNLGIMLWTPDNPPWAYTINPENKTCYKSPLEYEAVVKKRCELSKVELLDKQNLCGQKCSHYRAYRQGLPCIEFWTLDKLPYPEEVHRAWCKLFLLPDQYGYPVQVVSLNNQKWPHLFKLAEVRQVPIDTLTLKLPPDFKTVKNRADLYFSSNGQLKASDLDDLFTEPVK
jgi:hypothetical protein